MEDRSDSNSLIRVTGLIAAGSALIFIAALGFLAIAMRYVAQLSGYGPSYIVISPWPTAAVVLFSLAIVAAAAFTWCHASRTAVALAKRRSMWAIVATVFAWAVIGTSLLLLTHRWGAA